MHKLREGETVKEYAGKLLEIVNKIKLFGEPFSNNKVVEKMLISLLARFEPKISAIEKLCHLPKLTVAELISNLHAREQRIKELVSEGQVKDPYLPFCNSP